MANIARMAKQVVRGLPYLQKELACRVSLSTGRVFSTPTTYYIIYGGRCNVGCVFCTIWEEVDPVLSGETVFRLVRETKRLSGSGFNISLSGGEPLIFEPLYDTLALAHQLGVNCGFTTNGLALTKQIVERVLSHDPFNVNISLESVDPKINEVAPPVQRWHTPDA